MFDYLVIGSIAPVILLLTLIYRSDSIKEPSTALLKTFLLGCATVFPILIAELLVGIVFPLEIEIVGNGLIFFICIFIGVGIIEEFFKWIIVRFANYNRKYFDETFDAIVYATFASLGFAVIENLMYIFTSLFSGVFASLIIMIARFVTAVPAHCFFGIIMGYFFAKAKAAQVEKKKGLEIVYLGLSFFIPVLLHTMYDYLIMAERIDTLLLWLVFLLVSYTAGIIIVWRASKSNKILNPPQDNW